MDKKEIEKIIKEFFKKMTINESPENIKIEENTVSFEINTETPEILIGKRGEILSNIQYLLGRIFSKQSEERIFVDLDINQYKSKKADYLKNVAKEVADEVALMGQEKPMMPMSAFERRIVHMYLSERNDVISESQGDEPDRRIIIKPKK